MRRHRLIFVLTLVVAGVALAGPPASQPATTPAATLTFLSQLGYLQQLGDPTKLELTADQRTAIAAAQKALDDSLAAISANYKDQLPEIAAAEARAQHAAAIGDPREDPLVRLAGREKYLPYYRAQFAAHLQFHTAVAAALTVDQRATWEGLMIRREFEAQGIRRAKPTPAQQKQLEALYQSAGRTLSAFKTTPTAEELAPILLDAITTCRQRILTAAQCEALGFPWSNPDELTQPNR